jgi:hypothetical protein
LSYGNWVGGIARFGYLAMDFVAFVAKEFITIGIYFWLVHVRNFHFLMNKTALLMYDFVTLQSGSSTIDGMDDPP